MILTVHFYLAWSSAIKTTLVNIKYKSNYKLVLKQIYNYMYIDTSCLGPYTGGS